MCNCTLMVPTAGIQRINTVRLPYKQRTIAVQILSNGHKSHLQAFGLAAMATSCIGTLKVVDKFNHKGRIIGGSHGVVNAAHIETPGYGHTILARMAEETKGNILKVEAKTSKVFVRIATQ